MVSRSAASGSPQTQRQRAVARIDKTRQSISPLMAAAIAALLVTHWHRHCLPIMFILLVARSNIIDLAVLWRPVPKNQMR